MPTPTQVNTEDISELKTSIQRLADTVHTQEVTMERGFGRIERQLAEIGTDVRNVKGVGKWILGAVLTLLAGVGGAIWWASRIDYRVGSLEQQTKTEARP